MWVNGDRKGGATVILLPREEGQGLTEYALILLFIALVVVLVLLAFGPMLGGMYSSVVEAI
jgi:Flp pilus assembly pilin Flp